MWLFLSGRPYSCFLVRAYSIPLLGQCCNVGAISAEVPPHLRLTNIRAAIEVSDLFRRRLRGLVHTKHLTVDSLADAI